MTSQLVFIILLILLSKGLLSNIRISLELGWAITRSEITDKKVLTVSCSIFLLAYITMFVWENAGQDPASNIYIYESPAGIIILVLRNLAMFWFFYSIRGSYAIESDPSKKRFYLRFGSIYGLWFISLTFVVIIAALFPLQTVPYRLKVVTSM